MKCCNFRNYQGGRLAEREQRLYKKQNKVLFPSCLETLTELLAVPTRTHLAMSTPETLGLLCLYQRPALSHPKHAYSNGLARQHFSIQFQTFKTSKCSTADLQGSWYRDAQRTASKGKSGAVSGTDGLGRASHKGTLDNSAGLAAQLLLTYQESRGRG